MVNGCRYYTALERLKQHLNYCARGNRSVFDCGFCVNYHVNVNITFICKVNLDLLNNIIDCIKDELLAESTITNFYV